MFVSPDYPRSHSPGLTPRNCTARLFQYTQDGGSLLICEGPGIRHGIEGQAFDKYFLDDGIAAQILTGARRE